MEARFDLPTLAATGELWYWRGPAPFHFVTLPEDVCAVIAKVARETTYGWGMIPVRLRVGETEWVTNLLPKDGGYLAPLKKDVRLREHVDLGDVVDLEISLLWPEEAAWR